MIKLYYASGFIEVSDGVADAIMTYAKALADVGKSDLVTIPAIADDGTRGIARLLIGPSSELMASTVADKGINLDDDPLLEDLRQKVARLQPTRPQSAAVAPPEEDLDF